MNATSLLADWVQVLGLLSVEVGLLALLAMVLAQRCRSAAWRRACVQAGIVAVLAVTFGELSGAGRAAANWVMQLPHRHGDRQVAPELRQYSSGVPRGALQTQPPAQAPVVVSAPAVPLPQAPPKTPAISASQTAHFTPVRASVSALSGSGVREDGPSRRAAPAGAVSRWAPGTGELAVFGLGAAWFLGTVWMGGRAWAGHCLLLLLSRRRRVLSDSTLCRRVEELGRAMGIRRRVRVIASARLTGPVAFGLWRPTIGLPTDFAERHDTPRQEVMLAHELAHLAARDPWWCLLADGMTAVLWWHPAAWWLRRRLDVANELAADEASLLVADGPRVLAECLVELGARLTGGPRLGQLSVAGFRSHLGRRVQRLIGLEGRAWAPPQRARERFFRILGPMAMVAVVCITTAWATPQALTKGNSMRAMQLNWRRSLATFAVLTTIARVDAPLGAADPAPAEAAPATPAAVSTPAAPVNAAVEGRYGGAAATPASAATRARYGTPAAPPAVRAPAPPATPAPPAGMGGFGGGSAVPARAYGVDPFTARQESNPRRERIAAKLEVVLPEIQFDGLPLNEVVKVLSEQSRKMDPAKDGINFLLNPNEPGTSDAGSQPATVDPTTGLPLVGPREAVDIRGISIQFNLPLRNVSFKDVLEAMTRVADSPIQYSIEDYGVLISLRSEGARRPITTGVVLPKPSPIVGTYQIDTNKLSAGLESAFSMKIDPADSNEIRGVLPKLLAQLLGRDPADTTIFYNGLTGILMVRAPSEEQEVMGAVVETLGGSRLRAATGNSSGFGGGGGLGGRSLGSRAGGNW